MGIFIAIMAFGLAKTIIQVAKDLHVGPVAIPPFLRFPKVRPLKTRIILYPGWYLHPTIRG